MLDLGYNITLLRKKTPSAMEKKFHLAEDTILCPMARKPIIHQQEQKKTLALPSR